MTARSGSGGKRSAARLAAVQALYEMEITGIPASAVLAEFLSRRWPLSKAGGETGEADIPLVAPDAPFLEELVQGVSSRLSELDTTISCVLSIEGTPFDRMEAILRVILRAGAYELRARPDVPTATILNEYVEIAHAFFDGREPSLVNGILDKVAKNLRNGNGHGEAKPAQAG
ncbi:MAG: transcription antitermination factor NusB [Alphaproteobacteria bacterium]|nr:transcription antitermination factor NusB [Alphaproteobacteria bacterium]